MSQILGESMTKENILNLAEPVHGGGAAVWHSTGRFRSDGSGPIGSGSSALGPPAHRHNVEWFEEEETNHQPPHEEEEKGKLPGVLNGSSTQVCTCTAPSLRCTGPFGSIHASFV